MTAAALAPVGVDAQPISTVQWLRRDRLRANAWNPNRQAPPEHRLLRLSILENGWTQPVVAHQEGGDESGPLYEVVDGYHRWLIAADPAVAALTGGLLPVVLLHASGPAMARLATIRHNRARGVHHVLGMADIVADLFAAGMSEQEIGRRLEMDTEEVDRLADRGQMTRRGAAAGFGTGWTVGG